MTQLISLQGWDRLLLIMVQDNGQPWMMPGLQMQNDFTKAQAYSPEALLRDWQAPMEIRQ